MKSAALLVVLLALAALNLWHYGRRWRMSPDERKREDAATRDLLGPPSGFG